MKHLEGSLITLVLLPLGLGLLGFIEPCTIGSHMMFLASQQGRSRNERSRALASFIAARVFVTGAFGGAAVFVGERLIDVQTTFWLAFGLLYLLIGATFILGRAGFLKRHPDFAPSAWRQASNPLVLGLAFGFNIPACAAPILFGLLGLAATGGSVIGGSFMMAMFGIGLSAPLVPVALVPRLASWLDRLSKLIGRRRGLLGGVFVILGRRKRPLGDCERRHPSGRLRDAHAAWCGHDRRAGCGGRGNCSRRSSAAPSGGAFGSLNNLGH